MALPKPIRTNAFAKRCGTHNVPGLMSELRGMGTNIGFDAIRCANGRLPIEPLTVAAVKSDIRIGGLDTNSSSFSAFIAVLERWAASELHLGE
jgi:hypothetical protein